MDAGGDEQAIDPERDRTLEVGAHRVADRQHAAMRGVAAARLRRRGHRLVVDRAIRLAGIDHVAALGGIAVRDRAGAVDQVLAALDHDVGIGADHRQLAREHRRNDLVVVVRALGRVVVQAGADHVVRALDRSHRRAETFEDRQISRRADMRDPFARPLDDQRAGDVAGAHDRVVAVTRHLEAVDELLHELARARRIGDQHDGAATFAELAQRIARVRSRRDAVVHDAPDVRQQHVVVRRNGREMAAEAGCGGGHSGGRIAARKD